MATSATLPRLTFGETGFNKFFFYFLKAIKDTTIEPYVFLFAIGGGLQEVLASNLYFEKTCKVCTYILIELAISLNPQLCYQCMN